jgi:alpha-D-ribose 1-methylphosphonate 5-phosphate C-P lyase
VTTLETPMLEALAGPEAPVPFALLDEYSKREIRRSVLTAVAVPGYQVPFGSREMPVAAAGAPAASRSPSASSDPTTS